MIHGVTGWDAGAQPDQGYRAGGVSAGVFQSADCVADTLQPATKLPSSQRGAQGQQHRGGRAWAWAGYTWAVAVALAVP